MESATREVINAYYGAIEQNDGWQAFVSDDIAFDGTGVKATRGKDAYVESTIQFLQMVKAVQVKEMIVDGEKACIRVQYGLASPKGKRASTEVVEILTVRDGKIVASSIYFDTVAFNHLMAEG